MRLLDDMAREATALETRAAGYRHCGERSLGFACAMAAMHLRNAVAGVERATAAEGEAASAAAEA